MSIGHPHATLLHVTIFLTAVATSKPTSRVLTGSIDSFTNMIDTKK
jgi:hypothetical protein